MNELTQLYMVSCYTCVKLSYYLKRQPGARAYLPRKAQLYVVFVTDRWREMLQEAIISTTWREESSRTK